MKISKSKEKWGQIPNFKNYLISNQGKIKSTARKVWHSGSKTEMRLKSKIMVKDGIRNVSVTFLI